MHNIFISYAHSDGDQAERLVKAMGDLNVAGWLDETDIAAGAPISSALRNALRNSSAVVVLLSPGALESQWVLFEIGAADSLGKKIIPIIVSGEQMEQQIPEILKGRVVIDARGKPEAEVVTELELALKSLN